MFIWASDNILKEKWELYQKIWTVKKKWCLSENLQQVKTVKIKVKVDIVTLKLLFDNRGKLF